MAKMTVEISPMKRTVHAMTPNFDASLVTVFLITSVAILILIVQMHQMRCLVQKLIAIRRVSGLNHILKIYT